MKNRPYRLLNIGVIFAALTLAVVSVWWREHVGRSPLASLGGLIGLIGVLLFQAFYDTQSEVALASANARIDLQERDIVELQGHVAALKGRVEDLERPAAGGPR